MDITSIDLIRTHIVMNDLTTDNMDLTTLRLSANYSNLRKLKQMWS
jgi:hypothetical protein